MESKPSHPAPDYWGIALTSILGFLGHSLMQMVDLLFCKPLGPDASASVGTGSTLSAYFMVFGLGLISSVEFLIPKALGEKNERLAHDYFGAAGLLVLILSILSGLGLIALSKVAPQFGMNPSIVDQVQSFCLFIAPGYFSIFLTPLLRIELQSRGFAIDTTYAMIFGNLLNVFLNWVLVLGNLGVSSLGVTGSALSSTLSRFGILVFLMVRLKQSRTSYPNPFSYWVIPYLKRSKEILALGIPSSFHMLFEMGAFIFVGALASTFSTAENAAHTIAISIASFAFMVPAGLGSAAALTMSRSLGENKLQEVKLLGGRSVKLGLAFGFVSCAALILFKSRLMQLYSDDLNTIHTGTSILLLTGLFQFFDATQVILAGCIRGLGETKIQAYVNALGHWGIGIPLGLFLGYTKKMGVLGFWYGLASGLLIVSVILYLNYQSRIKKLLMH